MAKGRSKTSDRAILFYAFGERLKTLRVAKGLTPTQFSRAAGIDKVTLRRYEDGELEPKLFAIVDMAKALGVSHLELLKFATDKTNQ